MESHVLLPLPHTCEVQDLPVSSALKLTDLCQNSAENWMGPHIFAGLCSSGRHLWCARRLPSVSSSRRHRGVASEQSCLLPALKPSMPSVMQGLQSQELPE